MNHSKLIPWCSTTSTDIRKIDEKEGHVSIDVGTPLNYKAYKYTLYTKYYKTNILLLPLETELDQVPAEIIESVEAFLIYFDSGNVCR